MKGRLTVQNTRGLLSGINAVPVNVMTHIPQRGYMQPPVSSKNNTIPTVSQMPKFKPLAPKGASKQ